MPQKHSSWDFLFYFSLLVILFWLILKLTGVISSPPLLEYGIPIISGLLGFFALYNSLVEKVNKVGIGMAKLAVKVEHIEKDVDFLKTKI